MTYDMKIYEIRVNPSELDRIKLAFASNNMKELEDILVPDSTVEPGYLALLSPERVWVSIQFDKENTNENNVQRI